MISTNIAICDDDMQDAVNLENLILKESLQNIPCDVFTSGNDLINHLINNQDYYDVFFLDIEMQGINGIETAQNIRKSDQAALIVYVTNHQDYVYDVFETLPFRFLRKPVTDECLKKVWFDILDYFRTVKQVFVFIENRVQCQIFTDEIRYFESYGREIILHTKEKSHRFYGRIYKLAGTLNRGLFAQPNASCLVNMDAIFSIVKDEIILKNKVAIPITDKYRQSLKESYANYVKWRRIR